MNDTEFEYANPRIDRPGQQADAARGTVEADPVKIAWIGTMLVSGIVGSALTFSSGALLVFLASTGVTLCLGHSLGMHRRLIHRSYECPRWLEYLFVHFGVLIGLAGPLGMLRTHDTRDWAQRQATCHSYFSHDEAWYRDLYWQLFCTMRLESPPDIRIEAEIADDPVYRWMEKTWMLQQLPWAILLFLVGGWGWVFWGISSRVTVSVLGHWLIGYFAHNSGHRDWHVEGAAVQGFNVPFAALLTMGESWHNNHHAWPGSAKMGLEDGQWDPGWWVLKGLERAGLVSGLVLPDDLPARRELVPATNIPEVVDREKSTGGLSTAKHLLVFCTFILAAGCDPDWALGFTHHGGPTRPDFRFVVRLAEPKDRQMLYQTFEAIALAEGLVVFKGPPLPSEFATDTRKKRNFYWQEHEQSNAGGSAAAIFSTREVVFGWSVPVGQDPQEIRIIVYNDGMDDFDVTDWRKFSRWHRSLLPDAFPGARIEVDRHPAEFSNPAELEQLAKASGVHIPERYVARTNEGELRR